MAKRVRLQTLEEFGMLELKDKLEECGHEVFVCSSCEREADSIFQDGKCRHCLEEEFKKLRPMIDFVERRVFKKRK